MNPTVTATKQDPNGTWQNTLSNGQVITSANPNSIYAVSPSNVNPATQYMMGSAPTVISNETKKTQVTDMLNQASKLSQSRGQTTNGEIVRNADGSVVQDNYQDPELPQGSTPIYGSVNGQANRVVGYNTPNLDNGALTPTYFDSNSSTPAQSPEEKAYYDLLDQMKANTDAQTARAIASIQQKSQLLKQQQQQINQAQQAGIQNALLTGGVTGQGSSSQYAPISSENIVAAQMNYGVQQLAALDAQEQDLINSAQAAGDAKDFQILEKRLAMVEEKRKEKTQLTEDLNKKIADQNEKARETLLQSTRDNAIADLFSQGITDPKEMLKALNKSGVSFTLKEIDDGLKNIASIVGHTTDDGTPDPKSLTLDAKEFYALKEAGQLPESILSLPTDAEQLNAYLRNKAIAKKAPANPKTPTSTKPLVSGKLTYTKQDVQEDKSALEASRGADHFVDPTIYEKLYKAWISAGGLLADFLAVYPPKTYVNPENDWLPVFLRPAGKSTTTSSGGKTTIDDL